MRSKHERLYINAKSALVKCRCGDNHELALGAVEVFKCPKCGEVFHLADYRSPELKEGRCFCPPIPLPNGEKCSYCMSQEKPENDCE